jgi:hypothetical protein
MLRDYKYDEYLDSPQQLAKRIIDRLQEENEITFPIDPFKLLSMNGIVYQFRDFKELEGIYIAPLNQKDIPIVGINYNRPIPRQRFTAAHELCHHIKDRSNEACPIGGHKDVYSVRIPMEFAGRNIQLGSNINSLSFHLVSIVIL